MMKRPLLLTCLLVSSLVAGCEQPAPPPSQESEKAQPPAERTTATDPSSRELSGALFEAVEQEAPKQEPEPEVPQEEREMVAEVATVGAGKKGSAYGGGTITEPVRAYFKTRENIAFSINIPNAMKTFKALDPDGKGPKTHEEFMEKIIKENGIELPVLPDGHRYRYDPETEDLLVERPK